MDSYAHSELYADIAGIRQHSTEIRQEKRIAQHLEEHLKRARKLASPDGIRIYDDLIRRTDRLIHYFQKMSEAVEEISYELEELSSEMGAIFEDGKVRRDYFQYL